jgi:two-component system, chemotaxis family, response regulator Rcp1
MGKFERSRIAEILLVEDNAADVGLIEEAFKEIETPHRVTVTRSGEAALEYLRTGSQRPDLVLLDLKLPDLHGLEVLSAIKSDPTLRRIPTVVFSASLNRDEVIEAYNRNANSYIAKPSGIEEYVRVVKGVEEFWLTVVKLPKD